ncbi:MAG: hypothetical protein AB1847_04775 [bacterium]
MVKRHVSFILIVFLLCFPGCAPSGSSDGSSTHALLVQNPGFEDLQPSSMQPVGWSALPEGWSIVSNKAHAGKNSLRVQNHSSSSSGHPSQEIFLSSHKSYRIGLWVKGKELISPGQGHEGATFCIEYFDDNWTWLGGVDSIPGRAGTFDWQKILVEEVIIPSRWMQKQVAHIVLSPMLMEGTTGTAWFDDLSIEECVPPLLQTFLLEPNYRGMLMLESSPQIRLRAVLHPEEAGLSFQSLALHLSLVNDANEETVQEADFFPLDGSREVELSMPLSDPLLEGDYHIKVQLREKKGDHLLAEVEHPLRGISDCSIFTAFIDRDNRLLRRGIPSFPLGIYTANTELSADDLKAEIRKIADSPYHVLLNYNTLAPLNWEWPGSTDQDRYHFILHNYLDVLDEYGLKIFCPLPSSELFDLPESAALEKVHQIVNALKSHPAILGWYTNDEIGPAYYHQLMAYDRAIAALDPDHPTWSVQYQLQVLERMAQTTDILGVDPYPVPHTPLVYVAEAAEAAREAGQGVKPFWMVIQAHGNPMPVDQRQRPTQEEVLCMTYLGLIHGARGLFYYSYFDIWRLPDAAARWEWLKEIGTEVKSLEQTLLCGVEVTGMSCSQPVIHFVVKRHQDTFYLFMTNPSDIRIQAAFTGSGHLTLKEPLRDFLQPEESGPQEVIRNNGFIVTLPPLGRRVYSWPAVTNSAGT